MVTIIFATLLSGDAAARTIECRAAKSGTGYWSWRMVDGRRCWHQGRRVPRAQLRWPRPTPPPRVPTSRDLIWSQPSVGMVGAARVDADQAFAPPDPVHTFAWDPGEAWDPPPRAVRTISYPRDEAEVAERWRNLLGGAVLAVFAALTLSTIILVILTERGRRCT
jgi:hypothetical protein